MRSSFGVGKPVELIKTAAAWDGVEDSSRCLQIQLQYAADYNKVNDATLPRPSLY